MSDAGINTYMYVSTMLLTSHVVHQVSRSSHDGYTRVDEAKGFGYSRATQDIRKLPIPGT